MQLRQIKGTKEYLPEEQLIRERIVDTLKRVFKKYGYQPLETSILEYEDIAASKYAGGEEILKETYQLKDQGKRSLVLRYELTFKLGKLIGLNPNIKLPIKRYEIGKVFRDGPVKTGRLREFTQCDVDCVGLKSLAVDAELMALANEVFKELNINTEIELNNRKLLFEIFEFCKIKKESFQTVALTLDKLEKYGETSVKKELEQKKVEKESINQLFKIIKEAKQLDNKQMLGFFEKTLNKNTEGIQDLKNFFIYADSLNIKNLKLVPSLSRGLTYYTGNMFEIYQKERKFKSSLCAGGRWDEMIAKFLSSKLEFPAIGISFGLESITSVLKQESEEVEFPKVYIIPINTINESLALATKLRKADISCDIAFEKKLSKALDYANKKKIRYALIIGEEEVNTNKYSLKDLKTGKEKKLTLSELEKIK